MIISALSAAAAAATTFDKRQRFLRLLLLPLRLVLLLLLLLLLVRLPLLLVIPRRYRRQRPPCCMAIASDGAYTTEPTVAFGCSRAAAAGRCARVRDIPLPAPSARFFGSTHYAVFAARRPRFRFFFFSFRAVGRCCCFFSPPLVLATVFVFREPCPLPVHGVYTVSGLWSTVTLFTFAPRRRRHPPPTPPVDD